MSDSLVFSTPKETFACDRNAGVHQLETTSQSCARPTYVELALRDGCRKNGLDERIFYTITYLPILEDHLGYALPRRPHDLPQASIFAQLDTSTMVQIFLEDQSYRCESVSLFSHDPCKRVFGDPGKVHLSRWSVRVDHASLTHQTKVWLGTEHSAACTVPTYDLTCARFAFAVCAMAASIASVLETTV